jgi:type VI secretion system Hcp family effector
MSRYILSAPDCNGTAAIPEAGTNQGVECLALYHGLDLPVLQVSGSRRTEGSCVHGHLVMVHKFDEASPALRHKASGGGVFTDPVKIYRVDQNASAGTFIERIELTGAKIASVVSDVPVREDGADVGDELFEYVALQYEGITWTHGSISGSGTVAGAAAA